MIIWLFTFSYTLGAFATYQACLQLYPQQLGKQRAYSILITALWLPAGLFHLYILISYYIKELYAYHR